MIPAFTLGNAAAFVIGVIGVFAVIAGTRDAIIEDVFIGAVLIAIAWGIVAIGHPLI